MPSNKIDNPKLIQRANDLYWRSERSVNQIADEMDLSKSRLYGLIHPFSAGHSCPGCGEGLVFPNRTAREKGFLFCPACGFEGDRTALPEAVVQHEDDHPTVESGGRRGSRRILWASALLGIAAGLYVATRRRRS